MQKTIDTFSVYFKLRKPSFISKNWNGTHDLYLVININGDRKEIGAKKSILPEHFDKLSGYSKAGGKEAKEWNTHIDAMRAKLLRDHTEMLKSAEVVSAAALRNKYIGSITGENNVLVTYRRLNADFLKDVEANRKAMSSYTVYQHQYVHLEKYIHDVLKLDDLTPPQVTADFAEKFRNHILRDCGLKPITAKNYLVGFGRLFRMMVKKNGVKADCLDYFKVTAIETEIVPLAMDEVERMANCTLQKGLARDRDIFLFCVYTGLAYIDMKQLTKDEIVKHVDGSLWIHTHRQKTGVAVNVPLLKPALKIMQQYANDPIIRGTNMVLPLRCGVNINRNLKLIAKAAEITKRLSFHIARHTFATTITLSNDVPMETVSKMLGHATLTMTQRYAKIQTHKISNDMEKLAAKLSAIPESKKVVNE